MLSLSLTDEVPTTPDPCPNIRSIIERKTLEIWCKLRAMEEECFTRELLRSWVLVVAWSRNSSIDWASPSLHARERGEELKLDLACK